MAEPQILYLREECVPFVYRGKLIARRKRPEARSMSKLSQQGLANESTCEVRKR